METITFTAKANPELAQETYVLRYKIFTKKLHWFEDNTQEVETDQFDGLDRTTYVVMRNQGKIVAHCRLIAGSPSLTEQLAGQLYQSENHLCISRMYFARGYNTFFTNMKMAWSILNVGMQHDVEWFIGCTYQDFVNKQIRIPMNFPIWLRKDVDGFPSIFYEAKGSMLINFLKLYKSFL